MPRTAHLLVNVVVLDETALTGRVLGTDVLVRFASRMTETRRLASTGDVVKAAVHQQAPGSYTAELRRLVARFPNPLAR